MLGLGTPGSLEERTALTGPLSPARDSRGAEFPILGRAVQTLHAQVFTFLPGLATQGKPGLIRAKTPVPAAAAPPVRHVERCGGLMGRPCSSTLPPVPSFLQVPWRQLRHWLRSQRG